MVTILCIGLEQLVLHMSSERGLFLDFHFTPLFRWVSWYRLEDNFLALQILLVATSAGTFRMSHIYAASFPILLGGGGGAA